MDTVNQSKNKHIYTTPNNLLNTLLFWKLKPIENQSNTYANQLKELVGEYRILITITEPSPVEQSRIEEILELAMYDTVLSKLLDSVEQDIAKKIGLFEKKNSKLVYFPRGISHPVQKTDVDRPHIDIVSAILGGAIALLGVYIFNPCNILGINYGKEMDLGSSYDSKSKIASITLNAPNTFLNSGDFVVVHRDDFDNKNHILSTNLRQPKIQQIAQEQQICFESMQQQAELEQRLAEKQESLQEAKKWQERAQSYLQKAQYFRKIANTPALRNTSLGIVKTGCH
ncbi:hypothetical protein [Nostoc sp. FACHB-110]|uniref:hypothetical protein n=1 Tax=Nostoc sp. FACHB-110 TaxID=2692834 RepID=UPI001683A1DC|nr:hypothetical protein [Nostoc sp. FACHB-110]MBD2437688.1 hypothetical protein [Nostoc sp. FACHB-110]